MSAPAKKSAGPPPAASGGKNQQQQPKQKAKPIMRNIHLNNTMRNIYTAGAVSLLSTLAFYVLHNRRRMNKYKDFYAKYDHEKSFNRMMEAGILVSAPPGSGDDKDDKDKDKKKKK